MTNRAGEALLGGTIESSARPQRGRARAPAMLAEPSGRIVAHVFPGGGGRWEIRRRSFREGGKPHELLVISELTPRAARRRAPSVAAHRARHRPRAQQLARADQVDGGHRAQARCSAIRRPPTGVTTRTRGSRSFTIAPSRSSASWARTRGSHGLPPPTRRNADFAALVRRIASLHGERVADRAEPRRAGHARRRSDRAGSHQPDQKCGRSRGRRRRRARPLDDEA